MEKNPFYSYGSYLRERYGKPAFRVGIDAGFSCPNRIGGRLSPGCSYCDAHGARAMYQRIPGEYSGSGAEDIRASIAEQTEKGVRFLRKRYGAEVFLLYLQAFSNTNAPVGHLREVYDYALSLNSYDELIVSTRPDCIDREKAGLLASYLEKGLDVWVELGLQSSHDESLRRINRGHSVDDFEKAYRMLREYGIKLAVHLIFGLPGEGMRQINETAVFTAALKPEGVKFHNLHVPYNTPMYREYSEGRIHVPDSREHLEYVISAIERMPETTVIMRLTCDSARDQLAAPKDFMKKTAFYDLLRNEMLKRNSFQGRLYS